MDGWMDGLMEGGRMDGWTDGWIDRSVCARACAREAYGEGGWRRNPEETEPSGGGRNPRGGASVRWRKFLCGKRLDAHTSPGHRRTRRQPAPSCRATFSSRSRVTVQRWARRSSSRLRASQTARCRRPASASACVRPHRGVIGAQRLPAARVKARRPESCRSGATLRFDFARELRSCKICSLPCAPRPTRRAGSDSMQPVISALKHTAIR